MCGVVDGGIVPGLWGYEAGQSGVGDIFGWLVDNGVPPRSTASAAALGRDVHEHLTALALAQPVGAHGLVALDWHSGNRSVLVDHELSGLIVGLTLQTRPDDDLPGPRRGHRVRHPRDRRVVRGGRCSGGRLHRRRRSAQEPARDAGVRRRAAATDPRGRAPSRPRRSARRCTRRWPPACTPTSSPRRRAMARLERDVWRPDPATAEAYDQLYEIYLELHDRFGRGTDADAPAAGAAQGGPRAMSSTDPELAETIVELRRSLAELHQELVRNGLVVWTGGNVSARVPGHDLMLIKPSGVGLRRPHPRVDGAVRPRRHRGRGRPRLRRATPRRTPTSTATCPSSAGSSTPTPPTPSRRRRAASPSPACSPPWPTSSAATSPSPPSP